MSRQFSIPGKGGKSVKLNILGEIRLKELFPNELFQK
jgi:hypothetical protein